MTEIAIEKIMQSQFKRKQNRESHLCQSKAGVSTKALIFLSSSSLLRSGAAFGISEPQNSASSFSPGYKIKLNI